MPLLFLIADTGGGHRNAARAVSQALDQAYPGRFAPVLCDPLGGAGSARLLRWVTSLYGPAIRLAPWLWGAAYHACNSSPAMALLAADPAAARRPPGRRCRRGCTGRRPSCRSTRSPAWPRSAASDRGGPAVPVVTVVTDLVNVHAAWRCAGVDLMIAPLAARSGLDRPDDRHGGRCDARPGCR